MSHRSTIFSQLLKVFPRNKFESLVKRYSGDKHVRQLRCWDQFISLLYYQYSGRESLRDLESSFNSHHDYFYHLGCHSIKRSTLSKANSVRPSKIYEEVFDHLLGMVQGQSCGKDFIRLIDATVIQLHQNRFAWAKTQSGKGGMKIHTVYDPSLNIPTYFEVDCARSSDLIMAKRLTLESGATYVFDRGYYDFAWWHSIDQKGARFVTRLKSNSPTTIVKQQSSKGNNIILDAHVRLNKRMSRNRKNPYSKTLREVQVYIEGKEAPLRLITNDIKASAEEIAQLYKKRWQIELFFKWIKQNLKIKKFIGTSINAVKTQVVVAMIAYLLLHLNKITNSLKISMQTLARLVATNIMHKKDIINIIKPPDNKKYHHQFQQLNIKGIL